MQLLLDLFRCLPDRLQEIAVLGQVAPDPGVLVPCPALELDPDLHHPPHQRLGLVQAVGGLQQVSQVVESDGDVGVVRAITRLIDRQRPAVVLLSLGQTVGGPQQ